uniref:Uncharacterized protein n=1 Tax=Pyramimonas obovata TaxID=1411642 RepID=A0A7S0MZ22_9CHLO
MASIACTQIALRAARPAARQAPAASRGAAFLGGRKVRGSVCNGVRVSAWFKFGKNGANAEDAGIIGAQGRDEYIEDDVEQYFNYMGILAVEVLSSAQALGDSSLYA